MSPNSSDASKVLGEFKDVLASVEDFLQAAATQSGERLAQARDNMERVARAARETITDAEDSAKAAIEATERSIREHPWTAVSVSAGIGLILGLLLRRR